MYAYCYSSTDACSHDHTHNYMYVQVHFFVHFFVHAGDITVQKSASNSDLNYRAITMNSPKNLNTW